MNKILFKKWPPERYDAARMVYPLFFNFSGIDLMRVTHALVNEVERLWSTGQWSQRQISRALGICRATVRAIVLGQYTVKLRERQDDESIYFDPEAGPPQRCPTCGGTVYMPCHLCYVRGVKSQPAALRRAS